MLPKVSIIIVNYGKNYFIRKCLWSISKNDYPNKQVIVIDNNKKNLGFARACNQGAKKAKGKYLFFLNNDIKLDKKTVSFLVEKFQSDQKIGICACKVKSYDGKTILHSGIGIDIFGFPVKSSKIFYAEGSALMIKKDLFEKIGGFDVDYFMFHEDIDFAWRARLLGYKVGFVPKACIYHWGGLSAGGSPSKKNQYKTTYKRRLYSERNNLATVIKNYSFFTLIFILPFYFLVNVAEMLFLLIFGNPKAISCYLKSYLWNIKHLKNTLKKREKIQKQRKVSDFEIMKNMFFGNAKLLSFIKVGIPKFS